MSDNQLGWTEVVTNPVPIKESLTNPETRSEMLNKLNGYYIVLMDFHY
jgi:hypothetical protein